MICKDFSDTKSGQGIQSRLIIVTDGEQTT
jgi:hypothetical protein